MPPEADINAYMKDDHRFWREHFLAQTGGDSGMELTDTLGLPILC